jgi:hypothetical protein
MFRTVSKLSQAAAHPRRGTTLPVMDFPARNEHMLHNKRRKSKGENHGNFNSYMQEMMQEKIFI